MYIASRHTLQLCLFTIFSHLEHIISHSGSSFSPMQRQKGRCRSAQTTGQPAITSVRMFCKIGLFWAPVCSLGRSLSAVLFSIYSERLPHLTAWRVISFRRPIWNSRYFVPLDNHGDITRAHTHMLIFKLFFSFIFFFFLSFFLSLLSFLFFSFLLSPPSFFLLLFLFLFLFNYLFIF